MAKKNKSKTAKKKLACKVELKKQVNEQKKHSKTVPPGLVSAKNEECVNDTGIDVNDLNDISFECTESAHKKQLDSIATMSTRVDDHIIMITDVQKQLSELQIKQVKLLDGCANFFHELQGFQAENEKEEKLLLETFLELKTKVKIVFQHYLPTQVDMLDRDMKILQLNNNEKQ